jgi:hypothetical protein
VFAVAVAVGSDPVNRGHDGLFRLDEVETLHLPHVGIERIIEQAGLGSQGFEFGAFVVSHAEPS